MRRSKWSLIVLLTTFSMLFTSFNNIHVQGQPSIENSDVIDYEKKLLDSSNYFVLNEGQISNGNILFLSYSGNAFFTSEGMYFRAREIISPKNEESPIGPLSHPLMKNYSSSFTERGVVLKITFVNSNPIEPEGQKRCSWNTNYFRGGDPDHWYTDVPNYFEIVYRDIWDGIDLVYRIKDGNIKYDLIISPDGDPEDVQFQIDGHDSLNIDEDGDLVIKTVYGDIVDSGLFAFQGDNEKVKCDFDVRGSNRYGFRTSDYDRAEELTIDPALSYSTFIGRDGQEGGKSICIDPNGNAYITGYTITGEGINDYQTTIGAYDTTYNDYSDVIVTKLDPKGSSLIYSTFIGGSGEDVGSSICIDADNNAYITGYTEDSDIDYPTTKQYGITGFYDVFITKLSSTGSSLIYSILVGGSGSDWGNDICIDSDRNAIITGFAGNATSQFCTTEGAYDQVQNGGGDSFVFKLFHDGSYIMFSTLIGGNDADEGMGICVDQNNDVYIVGDTKNSSALFPTTSSAYCRDHHGRWDVFISKLDSTGSSLIYSTLIGGGHDDESGDICIDPSGNAYITGFTKISDLSFPTTNGSFNTNHSGMTDVFITKMDPIGSSIIYSTLVGGDYSDLGNDICIDSNRNVYVTGNTDSRANTFPTTEGSFDMIQNGMNDVFILKLSSGGEKLLYSTYIGGSNHDFSQGICIDTKGFVYITGSSVAYYIDYPTTSEAFDKNPEGYDDVIVTKLKIMSSVFAFETDTSNIICTTGDRFNFSIKLKGIVGGEAIFVDYWFGSTPHNNMTMVGINPYSYGITAPIGSTDTLHYLFHAMDPNGNWIHSPIYDREVHDNDPPIFGPDNTPQICGTGDVCTFLIQVTDNIAVNECYVEYWSETISPVNASMRWSGPYSLSIDVPDSSTADIRYIFRSVDIAGNWIDAPTRNISVIDGDAPELIFDHTPSEASTGDDFEIMIEAKDNIGINVIDLWWWFGSNGKKESTQMMNKDGFFVLSIAIPVDSIEPLFYKISIADLSGLYGNYTERRVTIKDGIVPIIFPLQDITIYLGEKINLTVIATDNIGVASYDWIGVPIEPFGNSLKGAPTEVGTFNINVTVFDSAGNSVFMCFNLTVLPMDHDIDGDGIPDLVELEWGLSVNDPTDALQDPDEDGIENVFEFENGTSPFDNDTDDDGMPDGWELDNGLDALVPSSDNDADRDGRTDLEEYIEGTDPNVKDHDGKNNGGKGSFIWILIGISITAAILLLLCIVIFLMVKKKNSKKGQNEQAGERSDNMNHGPPILEPAPQAPFPSMHENIGTSVVDENIPPQELTNEFQVPNEIAQGPYIPASDPNISNHNIVQND